MTEGRDRLRDLLDAVLDDDNATVQEMAADAFLSPFHFSRQLRRGSGESPMALRRRVLLERAAWQIVEGRTVTDAAWSAGFESVEGFSRAFSRAYGHPPSTHPRTTHPSRTATANHWLVAPNGIHFHPPYSLWVHESEETMDAVTDVLVRQDCDDTTDLLRLAASVDPAALRERHLPGHWIVEFDGPDESIFDLLEHIVWTKEIWMASFDGRDFPERPDVASQTVEDLQVRHEAITPAWLGMLREIGRTGRWHDRLIDALCEPPESFVISTVVAHVLTYSGHRRQLVRMLLRRAGHEVDRGDPIVWWRARHGLDNTPRADHPTQEDNRS